jgi:hypothetical protein
MLKPAGQLQYPAAIDILSEKGFYRQALHMHGHDHILGGRNEADSERSVCVGIRADGHAAGI